MHGNLWEWCLDSYAWYNAAAVTDPFVTGGTYRVWRGGGWGYYSSSCRSARRTHYIPGFMTNVAGFRVALAPALVP